MQFFILPEIFIFQEKEKLFALGMFYENKIRMAYTLFLITEKSSVKQLPFPGVLSAFIFP